MADIISKIVIVKSTIFNYMTIMIEYYTINIFSLNYMTKT